MDPLLSEIMSLLRTRRQSQGWTPHDLADALAITRPRLSRSLDELRQLGYQIENDPSMVLRVTRTPDRMIDTEILCGLRTRVFATQLHCYRRIGSTNSRAVELAESGAPEGTIVVAEEQTSGRGRLGRSWHSAPGMGIWSSVILRPQVPLRKASGLSLLAALAFARTAERECGLAVGLKWPNDGLIDGKKVFGVLTEVSAEVDRVYYAICGTGLNVSHGPSDFPPNLRGTATSLSMAVGNPIDRLAFYRAFLGQFEELYRGFRRAGITPFLDEYRRRSVLLGRDVVVRQGESNISGRAIEIDDDGALVIDDGRGKVIVFAGEANLHH